MSYAAIYYVFFIGVLIPALSIRSAIKLKAGAPFPRKIVYRISTLTMHGLMFLSAFVTWRSFGLPMFPPASIGLKEAGYGLGTLIFFLAVMVPMWRKKAMLNPSGAYRSMPQTTGEMGVWAAISLSAGFVEEITYRGLLFGILDYWLHNWWAAAILCAVSFGIGHAIQGWKSGAIVFVISVVMQGLVYVTGTLYVAMVVHAVYDFIAGAVYLYYWNHGAKDRMPAAPSPAPPV